VMFSFFSLRGLGELGQNSTPLAKMDPTTKWCC